MRMQPSLSSIETRTLIALCNFCECEDDFNFTFELMNIKDDNSNPKIDDCSWLPRNLNAKNDRIANYCTDDFDCGSVLNACTKSCCHCPNTFHGYFYGHPMTLERIIVVMYLENLAYLHIYIYLRKEDSVFCIYRCWCDDDCSKERLIFPNTYFTKTMKYHTLPRQL